MAALETKVDRRSEQFQKNSQDMMAMLAQLEDLHAEVEAGGGAEAMNRLSSRNKQPVRERIALVLDEDAPFLEISPLAGWRSNVSVGSGFIVGIGVVSGIECLILGHDPSVRAGAFNDFNQKKLMRGLEIARENRLPYIQLVESAGADLRGDSGEDPEAAIRRGIDHFAESGRLFYEISELSKLRIPTISVVFGASTAGGAYQPGMSDYNILIKKQSKVFLGGPPLVKMATGEDADEESLGGADMHTTISGLGDYLADDEQDGIRICREVVAHLNWQKLGPNPAPDAPPPIQDPEDLLGLVSKDLKTPFDIREVINRITDGSEFEEFKPLYGPTLVCGWSRIHGYPVGILGNNGALFSESAEKAAQFIQLCNQIHTPLVFLHNITGYIVGTEFEQGGITKNGSKMINAVSNSTVPHISIIVGASYGAGNYGMSGRAFGTRFTFIWPSAKIAVMGGEQAAKVLLQIEKASLAKKGEVITEEKEQALLSKIIDRYNKQTTPEYAASRLWVDEIIDPLHTRKWVSAGIEMANNAPVTKYNVGVIQT